MKEVFVFVVFALFFGSIGYWIGWVVGFRKHEKICKTYHSLFKDMQ